ncbi:MAG: bacteriocin [Candidatus Riflebacteria bacterium]|nr:bacteriocin [Candidatus Riflebacteria bacterium]
MRLIGNLKKQVEETKNKEEAKEVIEKAGMELTDEELNQVAGGNGVFTTDFNLVNPLAKK